MKAIILKILNIELLDPLLEVDTPYCILKHLVAQYAKLLPYDVASRRAFVISSGLAKIQQIAMKYTPQLISADLASTSTKSKVNDEENHFMEEAVSTNNSKLAEAIRTINSCYPEEIVHYYSPGYSSLLLEKINNYNAQNDDNNNTSGEVAEDANKLNTTNNEVPVVNENSGEAEEEPNYEENDQDQASPPPPPPQEEEEVVNSSEENINNDEEVLNQDSSD